MSARGYVYPDISSHIWIYPIMSGHVWISCLDMSSHVRTCSDMSGHVWIFLEPIKAPKRTTLHIGSDLKIYIYNIELYKECFAGTPVDHDSQCDRSHYQKSKPKCEWGATGPDRSCYFVIKYKSLLQSRKNISLTYDVIKNVITPDSNAPFGQTGSAVSIFFENPELSPSQIPTLIKRIYF